LRFGMSCASSNEVLHLSKTRALRKWARALPKAALGAILFEVQRSLSQEISRTRARAITISERENEWALTSASLAIDPI
jgi:hypothetical protein